MQSSINATIFCSCRNKMHPNRRNKMHPQSFTTYFAPHRQGLTWLASLVITRASIVEFSLHSNSVWHFWLSFVSHTSLYSVVHWRETDIECRTISSIPEISPACCTRSYMRCCTPYDTGSCTPPHKPKQDKDGYQTCSSYLFLVCLAVRSRHILPFHMALGFLQLLLDVVL